MSTNTASQTAPPAAALGDRILRTINRKTFCTVATVSPAARPHCAGVVYEAVDGTLWVHSLRSSRKVRNILANPYVGVCIPYRRLPVGPPFTIHFQAAARVVGMDDPEALELLDRGLLKGISGHGALEMADGCFVALTPIGTIHSFGPGARVIDLIRDPLNTGANRFSIGSEDPR